MSELEKDVIMKSPKHISFKFLIPITLTVILFFVMLFHFENNLIYLGTAHSNHYRSNSISKLEQTGFKQDFLNLSNIQIEYFEKTNISDKNVLFLGGNAEDVVFDLPILNKAFPMHNIYTLNYPNYGLSQGLPNEKNITEIIESFVKAKELNKTNLIIMGRSLGTGFATKIASKFKNTQKLILVSPYYSMENVAVSLYPFVPKILTNLFMENKINTYEYASTLEIPVLVLYAKNDTLVFNRHTEDLIRHIKNHKAILLDNETHDSILSTQRTIDAIKEFNIN